MTCFGNTYLFDMESLAIAQGVEEFFLDTGATNVERLFRETFQGDSRTGSVAEKRKELESDDVLDELSLDDSNYYKQKISKWVMNALRNVGDGSFWFVLVVAHRTRSPLLHFYRILCVKDDQTSIRMPIVDLVSTRIDSIQREFEGLVNTFHTWTSQALEIAKLGNNSIPTHTGSVSGTNHMIDERELIAVAATLLLHNAAAFTRRIVTMFNKCLD